MESVLYQNVQQNRTIFSLLTDFPIYKVGTPGDWGSVPLAPPKYFCLESSSLNHTPKILTETPSLVLQNYLG